MKLKCVLLLALASCFHDHLVLSGKNHRKTVKVVKGRGPFHHKLLKKKTISFTKENELLVKRKFPTQLTLNQSLTNIRVQHKTAVRQSLSTVAIPTTGFTAVKEAENRKPSSRSDLTRNGNHGLPPKKGSIRGRSTVVHPTIESKKTTIANRLKITKQGGNSVRTRSPQPISRNNPTSNENQSLPRVRGSIWSTSKVVQPTTKAKRTTAARMLKIAKHQGQYEIRTKVPKPSSMHILTSNRNQSLALITGSTQSTSKDVQPISKAKKTMTRKKLKITNHQSNFRTKLTKYSSVEAKNIGIHRERNQEKGVGTNDVNKHKTSLRHHWIKRPTFSEHPHSGYFGVIFILVIVLTLAMYGLYHNRQKIMVLVIEGRHPDNRPNSSQYRKLEDAMPSFKRI